MAYFTVQSIAELPLGSWTGIYDFAKYSNGMSLHGGILYSPNMSPNVQESDIFFYSKSGYSWERLYNIYGTTFASGHQWIKKGGKSYITGGYDSRLGDQQGVLERDNYQVSGYPPSEVTDLWGGLGGHRLPVALAGMQCVNAKGKIWTIGGIKSDDVFPFETVNGAPTDEILTTTDFDTYDAGGVDQKMPIPLAHFQIVRSKGKYYVSGGYTTGMVINDKVWEVTDLTDVNSWTEITQTSAEYGIGGLARHSMHIDGQWLHFFGGISSTIGPHEGIFSYDIGNNNWIQSGLMPTYMQSDAVFEKRAGIYFRVSGNPLDKSIYEMKFV